MFSKSAAALLSFYYTLIEIDLHVLRGPTGSNDVRLVIAIDVSDCSAGTDFNFGIDTSTARNAGVGGSAPNMIMVLPESETTKRRAAFVFIS